MDQATKGVNQTSETGNRPGALRQPTEIRSMFDRIEHRYDLMNRLMTGWMDIIWRRKAARAAIGSGAERVLDLATGTGDLALELARRGTPLVVGADFSSGMLNVARHKILKQNIPTIQLAQGDAMALPFPHASFDAVTVAFGLRNMPDYARAITEMARVLKPGGRLVVLEMTPMQQPVVRRAVNLYTGRVIPVLGQVVTGDRDAYTYLPESVAAFPSKTKLAELMWRADLRDIRYQVLGFGTVALHVGVK